MDSSDLAGRDTECLRNLHVEHGEALHAYARRLAGGDTGRAEELVQETLLRAWQRPDTLDPRCGAVRSWLFTIARNLAIDAWRRQRVRPLEVMVDSVPEQGASDHIDHALESWLVVEALSRLSPAHREVLVECFYRGESVTGAAGRLGIPAGTAKSRVHYALRSLRLVLDEMGVTSEL